jgi:hypothetical protein
MRKFWLLLVSLTLLSSAVWALDINVRQFCDKVGIRLSMQSRTVSLQTGQVVSPAKVTRPDVLVAKGLRVATGDSVSVTFQGGSDFKIKNIATGHEIVINIASLP